MHEIEYIGGSGRPPRPEGTLGPVKLWLALGVLAVVMVVFMQWFRGELFGTTMKAAPASVAKCEVVEGGQYSEFAMNAKALVKMRRLGMDEEEKSEIATDFKESISPLAVTRAERLRAAVVAGEINGKDEAISRIAALQKELELGSPLASDAAWLKIMYERGPEKLTPEVRASLVDRHGWFGNLALAFGQPQHDPHRRLATRGRERILSTFNDLHWLQVGLFVVGVGALALMATNKDGLVAAGQFEEPVPEDNLHAFVLFCMGFVVLVGVSLLPFGLGAEGSLGATVASELMIWSLLIIPAWPLLRGVTWEEFSKTVGFHGGAGVPVEILIGIGAFLAWMPVTIGMGEVIAAFTRFFGSSGVEGSPSGHPMFEAPPSDIGLLVYLSVIASVVWAPIIEETVFRGFLYGWLRERLGFVLSAIISSIVFGIIHPYSPLGMFEVAAAGIMFAILREWRGSLIAAMVAHSLHNGLIEGMSLAISSAIGG